jgi:hypothetical protein
MTACTVTTLDLPVPTRKIRLPKTSARQQATQPRRRAPSRVNDQRQRALPRAQWPTAHPLVVQVHRKPQRGCG